MPYGWASLQTSRLVLTPPTFADALAVLGILSDPRAVEHNPSDRLGDLDQAVDLVSRWRRQWERYGFGYWCLREPPDQDVVGYCGVKTVRFGNEQALNLIYRLAPAAWGRGLATEAASAVIAWAVEHVPDRRIIARVRPDNQSSQRVAAKAGLQRTPHLDQDGEDGWDLIFTLPAAPTV